ncbi:MAG: hypothetical protein HC827_04555 [Cyanobacteria bacterium RM1_2_2]|nr:hypothetical protein [Cyanobacteria bacterium RM1_2_2]
MNEPAKIQLKSQVEQLAAEAFHQHLISGYGDGEYPGEYQIAINGKPRHFPLEYAKSFLLKLVERGKLTALMR